MSYDTTAFTFWRGVFSNEELLAYVREHNDCPECEMFAELRDGDNELIAKDGYIEEAPTDQSLIDEIPRTLREALGLDN